MCTESLYGTAGTHRKMRLKSMVRVGATKSTRECGEALTALSYAQNRACEEGVQVQIRCEFANAQLWTVKHANLDRYPPQMQDQ